MQIKVPETQEDSESGLLDFGLIWVVMFAEIQIQ